MYSPCGVVCLVSFNPSSCSFISFNPASCSHLLCLVVVYCCFPSTDLLSLSISYYPCSLTHLPSPSISIFFFPLLSSHLTWSPSLISCLCLLISCFSPVYLLLLSISIISRISPACVTDVSPLFTFLPSGRPIFSPYHSYSPRPFTYLPSPLVFLPQVSLLSLPSPFASPCPLTSMAPLIYPSTLTHESWGNCCILLFFPSLLTLVYP